MIRQYAAMPVSRFCALTGIPRVAPGDDLAGFVWEAARAANLKLSDGVLVVFLNGLFGLDAKTGKQLWQQRKVRNNVGSLLGATLGGQAVVVTQRGDVVRPADGTLLFRPRGSDATGDTGWSPPVILGNRVYLPKYGVTSLSVLDFTDDDARSIQIACETHSLALHCLYSDVCLSPVDSPPDNDLARLGRLLEIE